MTDLPGLPFALLCDADGCLFPSEGPAYDASAIVTSEFLAELGITKTYSAAELRAEFTGLNFRATAPRLAHRNGKSLPPAVLEHWVEQERDRVTRHLADVLTPDPDVLNPLTDVSSRLRLAVVSSSAPERIDVSLEASGLARLFPADHRFSAESLDRPVSKPSPDVYLEALTQLGLQATETLAVEDSTTGVCAAVAAGIPVLGMLQFVPRADWPSHRRALLDLGAIDVVEAWSEVTSSLGSAAMAVA